MQILEVALSKNGLLWLAVVNAVALGHSSRPTRAVGGSSSLGSKKKNVRANISDKELEALRSIAADLLARTMRQLEEACEDGSLEEICHDDQS